MFTGAFNSGGIVVNFKYTKVSFWFLHRLNWINSDD